MRSMPYLLAFVFLLAAVNAGAQDVHFTLHDYNPLWLNPAQTGAFSGSGRVGGIYRGQWYTENGLSTPSAYFDVPVIRGFRKNDWIGAGANLISDRAGVGGNLTLKSNYFGFSAAYHLALDDNRRNVFTLGAQYGSTSYSLEVDNPMLVQQLTIDPSLGGGGQSQGELRPEGMGGSGNSETYSDINAGVMLRSVLDPDKDNLLEVGVAMIHLNGPKRNSLLPMNSDTVGIKPPMGERAGDDERRRRSTLHGHARLDLEVSEKWRFQPSLFVQRSAGVTAASLQAWGSRALRPNMDLRLGLGYRTGDAAQILLGLDYEQLRVALSYDITLSDARTVTNYQGGFEVSAAYIFNIYKKPTVVPTMLCPKI